MTFCSECGSPDLSTAAPPASFLHHLSGLALYTAVTVTALIAVLVMVLATLQAVDWQALSGPLFALVLMVGLLYWSTTWLPGPIKTLGKAAGRQLWKSVRKEKRH